MRLPANMRRGSGTGGRKSPRAGWPSGPICDWRTTRGKKIVVPADRQRIAHLRHRVVEVERRREPVHRGDGHVVDVRFLLADPFLELFEVLGHTLRFQINNHREQREHREHRENNRNPDSTFICRSMIFPEFLSVLAVPFNGILKESSARSANISIVSQLVEPAAERMRSSVRPVLEYAATRSSRLERRRSATSVEQAVIDARVSVALRCARREGRIDADRA